MTFYETQVHFLCLFISFVLFLLVHPLYIYTVYCINHYWNTSCFSFILSVPFNPWLSVELLIQNMKSAFSVLPLSATLLPLLINLTKSVCYTFLTDNGGTLVGSCVCICEKRRKREEKEGKNSDNTLISEIPQRIRNVE